jgi:hypothetical protein
MPQPLNHLYGGGGTLLVCRQMGTLLPGCPGGVVLEVEQVLRVLGQRSHPGVEVRTLEVGHSLKMLLPYRVLLIPNRGSAIGSAAVAVRRSSHKEVRAMCAISSTPVSGSLSMMDPNQGSVGSKGIVTLSSHWSMRWAMDSRQR